MQISASEILVIVGSHTIHSYFRYDIYTTNLEGISETGEEIMVKVAIKFLGQKGQYRKKDTRNSKWKT